MSSLYKIQEDLLEIFRTLEDNEGEISPELETSLSIKREELQIKVVSYRHILKNIDNQIEFADNEIKRIQDYKKSKEKVKERLEASLLQAVLLFGEEDKKSGVRHLEFDTIKLSTRKSTSVNILNELEIDEKYISYNITVKGLDNKKAMRLESFIKENSINPKDINLVANISKTELAKDLKENETRKEEMNRLINSGISPENLILPELENTEGAILHTKYSLIIK